MTIRRIFNCDQCGAERKEANHWFVVRMTALGLYFNTWAWAEQEGLLEDSLTTHLCGQQCAHKLLDQFLVAG